MNSLNDVLTQNSDHEHVRLVHAIYREVLDALERGAQRMRELGKQEQRYAAGLESWGRGLEVNAVRHLRAVAVRKE